MTSDTIARFSLLFTGMHSITELAEKPVCIRLTDVSTLVDFHDKFQRDKDKTVPRQVKKTRFEIVDRASAWMEPSKLVEVSRAQLPHTATFEKNDPWRPLFGGAGFNEIEYSTNAYFKNATLKRCSGVLHFLVRNYFKETPLKVYADEGTNRLSTVRESETARELIWPAAVLRTDHRLIENDHLKQHEPKPEFEFGASAKLRIFQRKYFVEGVQVKLSCSTEIDARQLTPSSTTLAEYLNQWKKVSYTVYWYVTLPRSKEEPNATYRFRVAFRAFGKASTTRLRPVDFLNTIARSDKAVKCNIECEDEITGPVFLDCAKALFAYYKFQHETLKEIVAVFSPAILASFMASESGREWTDENQRAILYRMKVVQVGSPRGTDDQVLTPNQSLCNFVGDLALKVWAKTVVKCVPKYAVKSEILNSPFSLPRGADAESK